MRIEFLDDYQTRARVTKGWLRRVTYVATRVPYSADSQYPGIGWDYVLYRWVYEGTEIHCSDSKAISKRIAQLERIEHRARLRRERIRERAQRKALKDQERDHLKGLGRLPEARLLRKT